MLRITKEHRAHAGLGLSVGIDTDSIARSVINAVMPAVADQMPNLLNAAWPTIQDRMPDLISSAAGPAMDAMWPAIQSRAPALIGSLGPQLAAQVPGMLNQALPILYSKLPEIEGKVIPMLKIEANRLLDEYAQRYLGPAAQFKEYAPAIMMIGTSMLVFAAGITIYRFWSGQ